MMWHLYHGLANMSKKMVMETWSREKESRDRYLDLMKKVLTHSLWREDIYVLQKRSGRNLKNKLRNFVIDLIGRTGYYLGRKETRTDNEIDQGIGWPRQADTMIGLKRLENLQYCCEAVIEMNIPGDFIEAGVWRGGATIFMNAVLRAHHEKGRKVWVADSYEGLPAPSPDRYPLDKGDKHHTWESLKISVEEVRMNFEKYNLLDENVVFLKGWFKDTLPNAPIDKLAVIRLDGDIYESTWDSITNLYPKLQPGGFIIIDDYYVNKSCEQAITDYQNKFGITEEINRIDWAGGYWQKSFI